METALLTSAQATIEIRPAYSISEFTRAFAVGRSKAYQEAAAGRLRITKIGGKSVVLGVDALDWLNSYRRAA